MGAGEVNLLPLPWSWSKLSTARKCSLAAFLSHHQLIATANQAPQRQESIDGSMLHAYARVLMGTSGKVTLTFPDHYTIPSVFFEKLELFFRTQFPALKASVGSEAEVFTELKLSLDNQMQPVYGWPNGYITGVIDVAVYNPVTQSLLILDYKSERNPELDLTETYRKQLELYALLFHHAHAPVSRYSLVIHACFTGTIMDLTDGWKDFDPVASKKNLITLATEALENLKTIKPTKHPLCKYCFVLNQCPLFK